MSWSSLHIYHHGGRQATDRFLIDHLKPAVERIHEDGAIASWFFIRYWEGGPHIRLRLRDASAETVAAVTRELEAAIPEQPASDRGLAPEAFYATVSGEADALARYGWTGHGQVAAVVYEPEIERYGGTQGVALGEEFFHASSRVAMAALQVEPDPQKRLLVALQLLLALTRAAGFSDLEAVEWLRTNVNLWPRIGPVSTEQAWRACHAAEREYIAKEPSWLKLRAWSVPDESPPGSGNLFSFWARTVRETMARYRELEAADQLTIPASVVLSSHVHMLHNRLGLTIPEECYLGWLASLIIARTRGHARFSDDSLEAYDRLYHSQSKLFPYLLGEQMAQATAPDDKQPPRAHLGPQAPSIQLGRSETPPNQNVHHLEQLLLARRSEFLSYTGTLTRDDLATLLELSVGRVPSEMMDIGGGRTIERKRRTHPSAGGRYPILTYALVQNVEGVPPGLYWFDVENHALARISAAPPIDNLLLSSQMLSTLDNETPPVVDARDAPVFLFPVADLTYQRQRYGLRSYRLVLQECGHMAQNIVLVATALGLTSITLGGFFDDLLNHTLLLDGVNRAVLYIIPIGGRP